MQEIQLNQEKILKMLPIINKLEGEIGRLTILHLKLNQQTFNLEYNIIREMYYKMYTTLRVDKLSTFEDYYNKKVQTIKNLTELPPWITDIYFDLLKYNDKEKIHLDLIESLLSNAILKKEQLNIFNGIQDKFDLYLIKQLHLHMHQNYKMSPLDKMYLIANLEGKEKTNKYFSSREDYLKHITVLVDLLKKEDIK